MGVMRSSQFWQLGSIASLATETTGGEILVAFWPKHGLRSDLGVPQGEHAPRPPWLIHKRMQWPYQSKIAGSGPDKPVIARQEEAMDIQSECILASATVHLSQETFVHQQTSLHQLHHLHWLVSLLTSCHMLHMPKTLHVVCHGYYIKDMFTS